MTTIDLHAHLVDLDAVREMQQAYRDVAPRMEEHNGKRRLAIHNRGYQTFPPGLAEPKTRISDMDRAGIDVHALMVAPSMLHYHIDPEPAAAFAALSNDAFIDLCDKYPDRFVVLANLPLQDADASLREIERIKGNRHVRGIGAGSSVAGVDLDAEYLEPVWAALEAADLGFWIHPDFRSTSGRDRLTKYYLQNNIANPLETTIAIGSIIHGGILERHPALRVGFCHGGGFVPYQIRRWDVGWQRQAVAREHIPDYPPSHYFEQMYFDSLLFDARTLWFLSQQVGWQRIVVGSDYPMGMYTDEPLAVIDQMRLPVSVEKQVKQENAERFLRSG